MAKVIHLKDIMANTTYEPPCGIFFGINNETVEGAKAVMGLTRSSPDVKNQRHYHNNCNTGQYRIKGPVRLPIGPGYDTAEQDFIPGDFNFIPRGELHSAVGCGESTELVFCYAGVGSLKETGTVFVEPPKSKGPETERTQTS
jgi:uncharacterized RmlC-like cupin family protein